jgi:YggT family protein
MIYTTLSLFINVIQFAIFADVILSLMASMGSAVKYHYIVKNFTKPILEPFEKLQSKLNLNIPVDLSPFLALIALNIIEKVLRLIF